MQNKADAQNGLAAVHCEDVSVNLTVDIKHTAHAPQAREEKKNTKKTANHNNFQKVLKSERT